MASEAFKSSDDKDTPANKAFPILDLPAELRNNIFSKVIGIYPQAHLTWRTRTNRASCSALPRVSRQIREEFLAVLYMSADVVADVTNFDLSRVITFFDRLRDAELKALPIQEAERKRDMIVKLKVTEVDTSEQKNLYRWLNRVERPMKKGVDADISYLVTGTLEYLRPWVQTLRNESGRISNGRKKDELVKIVNALHKVV